MGSKEKDFNGDLLEWIKEKNVKAESSTSDNDYVTIHSLTASLGSTTLKLTRPISKYSEQKYSTFIIELIRIYLTLLGDKARLITPERDYSINY